MKARTVCCKTIVNTASAPVAKNRWGEYLVCNDTCKKVVEMATEEQMKTLAA